jgi:colanic acid biosynthesis glycosyl transferase WcaI
MPHAENVSDRIPLVNATPAAATAPSLVPCEATPAAPERLRVLVYGLNFHPEPTGTGKYTAEMAQWLADAGHEVEVITAPPYYPDWRIGPGYSGWRYARECWSGIPVRRSPLWVPASPGGLHRSLHLASFAMSSLPVLLARALAWRPDVIFSVAPALASAPGALLAARLSGALAWLHIQDFEVDAAFEMGLLRGDRARKSATRLERALLRSFDRVSTISHRMRERLLEKAVPAPRSVLLPNWVDTAAIRPMSSDTGIRRALNIPTDAVVAMYSGTMGVKQGLDLLADAARRLQGEAGVHFLFCGQGAGRAALERACERLERVHWLPLQSVERLPELLASADVHLLPQQRAAADLVLPSKLTGMLASGRPVVATADAQTEIAQWVQGCGEVVEPGDGEALAQAISMLARDAGRRARLGGEARLRAVARLSRDAILREFLLEVRQARRQAPA